MSGIPVSNVSSAFAKAMAVTHPRIERCAAKMISTVQKKRGIVWVIVSAIALAVLSLLWALPLCFYLNNGWCHDWNPVVYFLLVPPSWFIFGLLVFAFSIWLERRSRPRQAMLTRLTPFLLIAVTGFYFKASETLRNCVRSSSLSSWELSRDSCYDWRSEGSLFSLVAQCAVHEALNNRNFEKARILLSYGAPGNCVDLCRTAEIGLNQEMQKLLLKSGAHPCPSNPP